MQLRLKPRESRSIFSKSFALKTALFLAIFFIAIFLLDKINFPVPEKLIKQEIGNEKIITLK